MASSGSEEFSDHENLVMECDVEEFEEEADVVNPENTHGCTRTTFPYRFEPEDPAQAENDDPPSSTHTPGPAAENVPNRADEECSVQDW